MALTAKTIWEVRTTGSSTNGGGYVAGSTGTDYSQQDSAQISVTDAVTAASTTVTSATANFDSTHVGNIIYLSGGTGSLTTQRRQVTSVTNSTTITIDASLSSSTGVTLVLGGAASSFADIAPYVLGSNVVFIKSGSYSQNVTASVSVNGSVSSNFPATKISGYATVRGDRPTGTSRPLITLTGGTNPTAIAVISGVIVENISIDCGGISGSIGISCTTCQIVNCKIVNFGDSGIKNSGNSIIANCEVSGGISGSTSGINSTTSTPTIIYCYIYNNICPGISVVRDVNILYCVISNNTGDGIYFSSSPGNGSTAIVNNIIYNNSSNGINKTAQVSYSHLFLCKNNIISENSGWGIIIGSSDGCPSLWGYDGNVFYKNTSGTRSHMDDTTVNQQNSYGPYINTFDITLTDDPFIDKAKNDFRLNNKPLGGLLCQNVGQPQNIPGLSTISYEDFGVFEHLPVINRINFNGGY